MARTLLQLSFIFYTSVPHILAGNALSSEPFPEKCVNRPGIGQRWACQDPALTFPTVACLERDILTCGKVKQNSCVFYSFGAYGTDARSFAANELGGKGVTFKNALDDGYMDEVIHHPRFGDIGQNEYFAQRLVNSENLNWREILIRMVAQAFASVCSDQAYLMVLHYNGMGGGAGIYQIPWVKENTPARDIKDNVWQKDEFPALTQNNKINKIISVDVSNNNKKSTDWVKGAGQRVPRNIGAMELPPITWPPGTAPQPPLAGQAPPR